MTAVTSGAVDIVKFLLSNGANPFVDRVSKLHMKIKCSCSCIYVHYFIDYYSV